MVRPARQIPLPSCVTRRTRNENCATSSVRIDAGRSRSDHLPLPRPASASRGPGLAIGRDDYSPSSGRPGGRVFCLPPPRCAASSARLSLLHGDDGLVDLLKVFLFLGASVSRWLEPDHLEVRRTLSFPTDFLRVACVCGIPANQRSLARAGRRQRARCAPPMTSRRQPV